MDLLSGKRPDSNMGALGPVFGASLGALGAVLEASWALLGVSWALLRRSWRRFEGTKAPKTEPGRIPHQVPQATRAENGKTVIFDDST